MKMKLFIKSIFGRLVCLLYGIAHGPCIYFGKHCKIVNNGKIYIGSFSSVRSGVHIYTDNNAVVSFGSGTDLGRGSTVSAYHKVVFENGVLTGPYVYIADHNHKYTDIEQYISKQGVSIGKDDSVIIGEGSWLGINAVVVGNVKIGKHCVIGANSVVTGDIPDYCVAVGAPAKIIKKFNSSNGLWEKV